MSHTEKTIPGTWYTLTCTTAATVTQQIAGQTATLATLTESGTATFRATATTITVETTGKYHILPTKAPGAATNLCNSTGGTTSGDIPADAASKSSNNTFSGTNTFNGILAANGGITGLPAPTDWSSAVSLRDSQLAAFAARIGERNCPCSGWELISTGGSLSNGQLIAGAGVCAVAKSAFNPLNTYGSYASMSALWLPLEMRTVKGSRCRILLMLQDKFYGDHYVVRQWENIDEPFYEYSAEKIDPNQQFVVAEMLIRVIEVQVGENTEVRQQVELLSYIESGSYTTGVKKMTCTLPDDLRTSNYAGIIGFLLVRVSTSSTDVYAVSNTPNQRVFRIGDVFTRSSTSPIYQSSTSRAVYVALQGGSGGSVACHVPDNIVVRPSRYGDLYYPAATEILRAEEPALESTNYSFAELWS